MNDSSRPLESLQAGRWFKLICGASFEDLSAIRSLTLAYTLAGADCIDVAADPAVILAAKEAIAAAGVRDKPWLMVSLNDGEDPHFRKAIFDPASCPPECPRPCIAICPAAAISGQGIDPQRCYGCGRCLPICPWDRIETYGRSLPPEEITQRLMPLDIEAIEIHTRVGRQEQFQALWQAIAPLRSQLQLISISCPDAPGYLDYLRQLYRQISPIECPLIWQTDGRPMSGDIGVGSTRAAVKLAQKTLAARLPGYVQLAGGTNQHTVEKLAAAGLLKPETSHPLGIAGVAYGSYARSRLSPILEKLDNSNGYPVAVLAKGYRMRLEDDPQLLEQSVACAKELVSQIKEAVAISMP